MFGKLACITSFHDYSAWSSKKQGSCIVTRYCRRDGCNHTQTTQHHDWNEWVYDYQGSCEQTRTCSWCSGRDHQTAPHMWGVWQYEAPNSCTMVRHCNRCNIRDEETQEAEHKMKPWFQPEPHRKPCLYVRECERCGFSDHYEDVDERHEWSESVATIQPCVYEQTCIVCRETTKYTRHEWDEWRPYTIIADDGNEKSYKKRACLQCGRVQDTKSRSYF